LINGNGKKKKGEGSSEIIKSWRKKRRGEEREKCGNLYADWQVALSVQENPVVAFRSEEERRGEAHCFISRLGGEKKRRKRKLLFFTAYGKGYPRTSLRAAFALGKKRKKGGKTSLFNILTNRKERKKGKKGVGFVVGS